MWKFLVILSVLALAQSCRVIEQKANGMTLMRDGHPSLVLLEPFLTYEQKYLCAGVLISADYVLTTASCVFGANFINVHVNAHKLRDVHEDDREIYRSTVYSMHPEYDGFNYLNDVALVKLPSTLRVNERPYAIAQLPERSLAEGDEGRLLGWGLLELKDDNAAEFAQEQTLSVVNDAVCRASYPGKWNDESTSNGRVCITGATGANCVSDVGSPFMIGDVVYGLQSFGQVPACDLGYPNGVQDVGFFSTWINTIVQDPQVLSLKV